MTDCSNAEIRDLLPDYLHDQLSNADLARVEQHVASCADCADEVELLQTVLAIRPSVKTPNIADILASLPKPGQLAHVALQDNVRVMAVEGVRDISSAKSVARKSRTFSNWRAIAAVAVLAVGAVSITMIRQGVNANGVAPMADSATVAELQSRRGPEATRRSQDSANAAANDGRISLSVGDPADYTEEELKDMMARLDKWDGSVSAEPLPGVPILPPGFLRSVTMFSRHLMRCRYKIFSAALLALSLSAERVVLAQTVPDSGVMRGRGGGGGRGGNRQAGPSNPFDAPSPEMFQKFVEGVLRSDRVSMTDEQITKWRAWNKRFDPERRALAKDERDARAQLRVQLKPGTAADETQAAAILDRLEKVERKWVDLHERENRELAVFLKQPMQRLRFYAFQDFVKREFQEMQNRRDGGRGNGGQGGRGGPGFGPDSNKFRGMRGDSTGGKFQRGNPPVRAAGRVDTFPLVQKPQNN